MSELLSNVRSKLNGLLGGNDEPEEMRQGEQEYVELDTATTTSSDAKGKIIVRSFTLDNFEGVKVILDSLRDGSIIALVNIRPLREKDEIELKRAVDKLKKTAEAISGDIAGFWDDFIVVTPDFARIYREKTPSQSQAQDTQQSQVM